MSLCTVCNWTRHDVSVHGRLCPNGHALEVVGTYTLGQPYPVCRACQRAAYKRYRDRNLERERERVRRYQMRVRRTHRGGRRTPAGVRGAGASLTAKVA